MAKLSLPNKIDVAEYYWKIIEIRSKIEPFIFSVVGAVLIVTDNFILGDRLKLHNIPSWIGNGLLIGAALWSGRD